MLLYYPQRVNGDMGPTVLLNGEFCTWTICARLIRVSHLHDSAALRWIFLEFAGSHYLSADHGASSLPPVARSIPYGEDRLDWAGSLNGTYRSADLRFDPGLCSRLSYGYECQLPP